MRKQLVWITIVLVLCACSITPPTEPNISTASSATTVITSASAVARALPTTGASSAATSAPSSTAGATLGGSVWRDVCDSSSAQQPPPTTPPPGCVAGPAGGFVADGTRAADEPPIATLRVTLATGACPGTPSSSTETDAQGRWTFPDLVPDTYCVVVDSLDEANLPLLLPGTWTAPAGASNSVAASAPVTLGANEQRADINFGWDYQLLP